MMNYVVQSLQMTGCRKIVAAQAHHKRIDGHTPGVKGKALNAYVAAGVYYDHRLLLLLVRL